LLKLHSKDNDELNAILSRGEIEDIPRDVSTIFEHLKNSDQSPYYGIYGKIALDDWPGVMSEITLRLEGTIQGADTDELPPHELRFYAHLVLLASRFYNGESLDKRTFDKVILRYVDLLVRLPLYNLVPFYLYQLTDKRIAKNKMIDTLERIRNESEQKNALERAIEAGFLTADLCRHVFERFKNKYPLTRDDNQCARSIFELINSWKWLIHCGVETCWDALIEANCILRKLFILQYMKNAVDFMSMIPENLISAAVSSYKSQFPNQEKLPEKLDDAKREFECYFMYFDAIEKYNAWQKHTEGQELPKPPQKLSDEAWARLDIRRRTEYELSLQKSRDYMLKHLNLADMLNKAAVESLERLLKNSDGWLATLSADEEEDNSDTQQNERARDFRELRCHYFFHILKLLIDIHSKAEEPMKVIELASLIVDPCYNIHKALTQDSLRHLLSSISIFGAVLDMKH